MAEIEADNSRNEVQIDLDKYMKLVDKLDAAEDLIEKMKQAVSYTHLRAHET